jgi:hypothetical protein
MQSTAMFDIFSFLIFLDNLASIPFAWTQIADCH